MLKPGLNKCTNKEYHEDREHLSSSVLKTLYTSLEKYHKEYILGQKEQPKNADALNEGSLTHSLILEPDLVSKEYNFFPGWRKAGKEYESYLETLTNNNPVISEPQKHRVMKLIDAYTQMPQAFELFSGGEAEQTLCVKVNDVKCKVRYDYINWDKGYVVDIKTTGYPGDIESFKITLDQLKYNLSAALYLTAAELFYGKKFKFYFVILSKKDFNCNVYVTSERTRADGERMVVEALNKYKSAMQTNVWTENALPSETSSEYEIQEV